MRKLVLIEKPARATASQPLKLRTVVRPGDVVCAITARRKRMVVMAIQPSLFEAGDVRALCRWLDGNGDAHSQLIAVDLLSHAAAGETRKRGRAAR
jgi:hypothetical protein